jgi:Tol biopolymer transport system component
MIFFLGRTALFRVNADGSDRRKIADVPEGSYELRASPGPGPEVLRFSVFRSDMRSSGVWEVSADGSGLHPLSKTHGPGTGWPDALYSGDWIPSGRYYVMRSRLDSVSSFWALRETRGLFERAYDQPVKIYGTPLETRSFTPSRDGKRIFFAAAQERTELVRFDPRRGQFLPFLPGIAVRYLGISKDRREIAYTTVSDDALWKSMADGSGRVQLTTSANLRSFRPRWSPDGNLIAFTGSFAGKPSNVYVIPSAGGTPQTIDSEPYGAGGSWSPDGSSLLVTRTVHRAAGDIYGLYITPLKTRKAEFVTGSENLSFGAWSPDGRYIAAMREQGALELLDVQTRQWSHLVTESGIAEPFWSHDSKYVYFQNPFRSEIQPIFRVRINDRKIEQITTSKQIPQSGVSKYSLCALTEEDAPIAALSRNNSDIYALDVDLP